MTITTSLNSIPRVLNGRQRQRTVNRGAPEPPVGTSLHKGAPVGLGDNIQFERVDHGPDGWVQRVNGNPRGRRVAWPSVAFWLPMEGPA